MQSRTFDVIVLGQGLSGTLMAHMLRKSGKRVYVFDREHVNSASRVAAGMWNPLAFKRFNISWKAAESLPIMREVFLSIQDEIEQTIFHERKIKRIFADLEASESFELKSDLPNYQPYIQGVEAPQKYAPFGVGVVSGGGYVDLPAMIAGYRKILKSEECYSNKEVTDDEIQFVADRWAVNNVEASAVVCCRGNADLDSRYWSQLPIQPNKGEVLTVKANVWESGTIMNNGKFCLAISDDLYRLGSTFNWRTPDEIPTEEGKDEILSKFTKWYPEDYELVEHRAGMRPTVKDRRPLAGEHPEYPGMFLLNGLGSRGVLNGPRCAQQLLALVNQGVQVEDEIDLRRFL